MRPRRTELNNTLDLAANLSLCLEKGSFWSYCNGILSSAGDGLSGEEARTHSKISFTVTAAALLFAERHHQHRMLLPSSLTYLLMDTQVTDIQHQLHICMQLGSQLRQLLFSADSGPTITKALQICTASPTDLRWLRPARHLHWSAVI